LSPVTEAEFYHDMEISELHLDALREISNIGMGHAATAMNQMIGRPVRLSIPEAGLITVGELPEMLGGPNRTVAGIHINVWGDITGTILLVIPRKSTAALCSLLLGQAREEDEQTLNELESSALQEIGNIVVSSYLSALERLLEKTFLPSVPTVTYEKAGDLVDRALVHLGEDGDRTMVIRTDFMGDGDADGIKGHFFLLPDPESLKLILKAARVLKEEP